MRSSLLCKRVLGKRTVQIRTVLPVERQSGQADIQELLGVLVEELFFVLLREVEAFDIVNGLCQMIAWPGGTVENAFSVKPLHGLPEHLIAWSHGIQHIDVGQQPYVLVGDGNLK